MEKVCTWCVLHRVLRVLCVAIVSIERQFEQQTSSRRIELRHISRVSSMTCRDREGAPSTQERRGDPGQSPLLSPRKGACWSRHVVIANRSTEIESGSDSDSGKSPRNRMSTSSRRRHRGVDAKKEAQRLALTEQIAECACCVCARDCDADAHAQMQAVVVES
jgi:hypothetical protein